MKKNVIFEWRRFQGYEHRQRLIDAKGICQRQSPYQIMCMLQVTLWEIHDSAGQKLLVINHTPHGKDKFMKYQVMITYLVQSTVVVWETWNCGFNRGVIKLGMAGY